MLLEQILKLDCKKCKLRTEHYVQFRRGVVLLWCLRCGRLGENLGSLLYENDYPVDNRRPAYVT